MVGINSEEIFSKETIDTDSVVSFVEKRGDMVFPIAIDVERIAVKGECPITPSVETYFINLPSLMKSELFEIAGRRAVPTGKFSTKHTILPRYELTTPVFIISIKDGIVHFVGDPADVDGEVDRALASS